MHFIFTCSFVYLAKICTLLDPHCYIQDDRNCIIEHKLGHVQPHQRVISTDQIMCSLPVLDTLGFLFSFVGIIWGQVFIEAICVCALSNASAHGTNQLYTDGNFMPRWLNVATFSNLKPHSTSKAMQL